MIPYQDLVCALMQWRTRQGLPTHSTDYLGEPQPTAIDTAGAESAAPEVGDGAEVIDLEEAGIELAEPSGSHAIASAEPNTAAQYGDQAYAQPYDHAYDHGSGQAAGGYPAEAAEQAYAVNPEHQAYGQQGYYDPNAAAHPHGGAPYAEAQPEAGPAFAPAGTSSQWGTSEPALEVPDEATEIGAAPTSNQQAFAHVPTDAYGAAAMSPVQPSSGGSESGPTTGVPSEPVFDSVASGDYAQDDGYGDPYGQDQPDAAAYPAYGAHNPAYGAHDPAYGAHDAAAYGGDYGNHEGPAVINLEAPTHTSDRVPDYGPPDIVNLEAPTHTSDQVPDYGPPAMPGEYVEHAPDGYPNHNQQVDQQAGQDSDFAVQFHDPGQGEE